MEKTPSIKKNFMMSNLYEILIMIIPFITAPYVSRVLGANGIGVYSYTNSIQTYFSMFAALGTVSYGRREISRNRNDYEKRSLLFWEIELVTVCTTLIALLFWGIWVACNVDYKIYYFILTLNIIAVLADISWFFSGLEQFGHIVVKNSIFKVVGVICIFMFVRDSKDLNIYIGIMAGATLLGNLSMWMYLPSYLVKIDWKRIRIRRHIKETLVYFAPTIATSIYTVLDKTLIGVITQDEAENGYYEQATKIIGMARTISFASLNSVLGARIAYLFVENKIEEIKSRIKQSIDYILFMGIGFCFGIIGIADTFIPWYYGNGYEDAIVLLRMMSPLIIIIGISNCLGSHYYTPAGLRKKSVIYLIYGSITNLILNLILIPVWQGQGAVFGSLIAECLISYLYVKHCDGFLLWKQVYYSSQKKIIAGLVMLIGMRLVSYISMRLTSIILVQFCIGVLLYVLVLYFLKDSILNILLSKIRRKGHGCRNDCN